ncbi:unnamed protein product [Parajaminaea phylloscopi]
MTIPRAVAVLVALACLSSQLLAAYALQSASSPSSSALPSGPFAVFNAPPYLGSNRPPAPSLLEQVLSPDGDGEICRPTGQIEDACCDYETVEKSLNTPRFYQTLVDLVKTNYFRYYKVDLFKDCPYWVENGLCMNRACGVEKAVEDEVPEAYRSGRLSSVSTADTSEIVFPDEGDLQLSQGSNSPTLQRLGAPSSQTCRDSDFCHWEQEEVSSESVWVDLIKNPERFTGYAGKSANRVWKAIYEENCFGAVPKGSFLEPPRAQGSGGSGFVGRTDLFGSSNPASSSLHGLSGLMPSLAAPVDPASNEQCLEKRVFYRVISGLHASISMHVCHEYLNQTTGEWSPNLECFISRIAQHPERLQNVYFNYVLLVRALARAGEYLTNFNLKPGHGIPGSETQTIALLKSLVGQANSCPPTFDEALMFKKSNPEAPKLKAEFRDHFRNVSSIMDCVGCDKCRLWGKMQTNGLGTAMKILFSFDDSDFDPAKNPALLERSELVALINTLHRFAESLKAVETFREMYQHEVNSKKEELGLSNSVKKSDGAASASAPGRSGRAADPQRKPQPPPRLNVTTEKGKPEDGSAARVDIVTSVLDALRGMVRSCRESMGQCLTWTTDLVRSWGGGSRGGDRGHQEL